MAAAVAVIKRIAKGIAKEVYDAFKENLLKDWKTVKNYSLLAIGFSVSGYLMYRNRSGVYSSFKSMVYTKEERINRCMNEWMRSNKGDEDHRNFIKALTSEISESSNDVSKDFLSKVVAFIDKYREWFGYGTEIKELYSYN